jgi:hypothetical protein
MFTVLVVSPHGALAALLLLAVVLQQVISNELLVHGFRVMLRLFL